MPRVRFHKHAGTFSSIILFNLESARLLVKAAGLDAGSLNYGSILFYLCTPTPAPASSLPWSQNKMSTSEKAKKNLRQHFVILCQRTEYESELWTNRVLCGQVTRFRLKLFLPPWLEMWPGILLASGHCHHSGEHHGWLAREFGLTGAQGPLCWLVLKYDQLSVLPK